MLELNSGTLGHLKSLLGRDSGAGGSLPTFNAIGIDVDLYEAPSNYEVRDGVPEAYVSTHRLALYRPGGSGGFIAGMVYTDSNRNGYYDVAEGSAVTVNVRDTAGNGFTDTLTAANYGAFSGYVGNGTYTVTISSGGTVLDSRVVTVINGNAWAGFPLSTVGRPIVTSPVGEQNALRPTVAWTTAQQATGYEVRVDDLTSGATNLFNNAGTGGTSWAPGSDLVSGRAYRVWVRAVQNGVPGAWSDPKDFNVLAPHKNGPLGTASDIRPVFSWTPVAGATSYAIRVNDISAQLTNVFPGAIATGTSWQPPTDLASGRTYTWQVRAVNQTGLGAWSSLGTFVVGKPRSMGPSTGVASLRPTFTWTGVNNAASYEVVVNDNSAAMPNLFRVRVMGTSWAPPADLVSGRTYTWQVRAVNAMGQGMWSPLASFVVGRPILSGPVGSVANHRPAFTWSGIGWAPAYQIRVDDVTAGQVNRFLITVSNLDWVPPTDLNAGHTYRWSVRAVNSNGLGMWSPAQVFRVI